ncbi:MAG TPA: hypothetical protein VGQ99_02735 [Tepidisphaeraceae bacterium]|nr:hypothetical protein [Tepidisphaeraceae bacterium]
MPLRVRCPRCWETAEISEDLLGRQGQCNNCGSLVAIPTRLTKVCFVCGVDVSQSGHTKDKDSNYLCTNCWQHRKPAEQSLFFSAKAECSICHVQFPQEEAHAAHGQPICRDCATILQQEQAAEGIIPFAADAAHRSDIRSRPYVAAHHDDADDHHTGLVPQAPAPRAPTPVIQSPQPQFDSDPHPTLAAVAEPPPSLEDFETIEPTPRRSAAPIPRIYTEPAPAAKGSAPPPSTQTSRLPLILSSLALAGVIVIATIQWSSRARTEPQPESNALPQRARHDNADQEALTRLLILKGQAEVLIEVGKVREGIRKYDEILSSPTPTNPTLTSELEKAKQARDQALKLLATSTTQLTSPVTPDDKGATGTDPSPKKTRSIFDE